MKSRDEIRQINFEIGELYGLILKARRCGNLDLANDLKSEIAKLIAYRYKLLEEGEKK